MSRRARPAARGAAGFGLLETLAGIVVFIILIVVGTRVYRGVVANHSEASEVKALTDAVATTAERLSGFTMAVLAGPGSPHVNWSAPAEVGNGTYHYRYRIVPRPNVGGRPDTTVVGLEVEAGDLEGGRFTPARAFATLIPPNLSAKGALGAVSTKAERDAEKVFHDGLNARIDDLTERVVSENQLRLNSFSCYDKGQCCNFMRKFFLNPGLAPEDGLEEKCHYRCALGGDVPMEDWRRDCGIDFCAMAPWKTRQDCCAAIKSGECKSGSVCARVCIDCVGEDGTTCEPPSCGGLWWTHLFDCGSGTFCDGSPLPDGSVPGWGYVKSMCKLPECQEPPFCDARLGSCCSAYWHLKGEGKIPDPRMEICATISKPEECCSWEANVGYWQLYCRPDGRIAAQRSIIDGQWYCGLSGGEWDVQCNFTKVCSQVTRPPGAPDGGCRGWAGLPLSGPWVDPRTGQLPVATPGAPSGPGPAPITKPSGGITPVIIKGDAPTGRKGAIRDGDGDERKGGRE